MIHSSLSINELSLLKWIDIPHLGSQDFKFKQEYQLPLLIKMNWITLHLKGLMSCQKNVMLTV